MVSPSLTLLRTQSDERLVALARAGHERAFEAIVERYRRPLLRHGRRLLSEARSEEAVQQALVAAWTALQRGDDVRHLSGWLHRIVHNAALNALRGERDDHAELREWLEGGSAPEEQIERREMLRETLANLAALPERQREALLRVAVDGASAETVGGSLGLTEGAVRQLLYRARTALRAAATALTPFPVAGWIARAEPLTAQVAEATAGAGSAGVGALLAKGGVVAAVAVTAAAAPAVIHDGSPRAPRHDRAIAARVEPAPRAATPAPVSMPPETTARRDKPSARRTGSRGSSGSGDTAKPDSDGPGSSGSGTSGSDGSGGPGSGGSGSGHTESGGHGGTSSGSDSSGSGTSGSGTSGSGTSGTSGSGTSGSGTSGSGTSGSGTSGSGTSGSGTSGSGTSGSTSGESGSSGSGSSGSGSSGSGSSGSGSTSSGSGSSGSGHSGSDDPDGSASGDSD